MALISLRTRTQPTIGEMRDVVIVCTTVERPDDWVSTTVDRPGVYRCHARIRDLRADQVLDYKAIFGDEDAPTKEITVRVPPDVKVDLNHWIYRVTGPANIWYKVRAVEDQGEVHRFLNLRCSVDTLKDQRSDPATQRNPPVWEQPDID